MTPMETASNIVSDTFAGYEWRDFADPGTLKRKIAEALQRESTAQLDRDREIIQAYQDGARFNREAWEHADNQRTLLARKLEVATQALVELNQLTEAIQWLETQKWDCQWNTLEITKARPSSPPHGPRWIIGRPADEIVLGQGDTILAAITNSITAMKQAMEAEQKS